MLWMLTSGPFPYRSVFTFLLVTCIFRAIRENVLSVASIWAMSWIRVVCKVSSLWAQWCYSAPCFLVAVLFCIIWDLWVPSQNWGLNATDTSVPLKVSSLLNYQQSEVCSSDPSAPSSRSDICKWRQQKFTARVLQTFCPHWDETFYLHRYIVEN